jgi:hypothetical protein
MPASTASSVPTMKHPPPGNVPPEEGTCDDAEDYASI